MSENLKMLWSFAMMLGLFAYFMNRGAKDLARFTLWLRNTLMRYTQNVYSIHCEVCRLRRLQRWRRWFNRHPGIRSSRNITLLFLLMLIAVPSFASQANWYFGQSTAGSADGSSCANQHSAADFNNAANWGSGSTQIGTTTNDTVARVCGTVTSALTFHGSGSAGHPITLTFESGAKVSMSVLNCVIGPNSNACMDLNSNTYLLLDGGTDGIIEVNDNGTGLAHQNAVWGIYANVCTGCRFTRLMARNFYVRTSSSDFAQADSSVIRCLVLTGGSNIEIDHNTFHDSGWCITTQLNGTASNLLIHHNDMYNNGHNWQAGGDDHGTPDNIQFYNNHVHDLAAWNDSRAPGTCTYHNSAIHLFSGIPSGDTQVRIVITNVQVYDNTMDGDVGNCPTGWVFPEGGDYTSPTATPWTAAGGNINIFNNFMKTNVAMTGILQAYKGTGNQIYNNTVVGPNYTDAGFAIAVADTSNIKIKNNVMSGANSLILISAGTTFANIATDLDYNAYGDCTFPGSFNCWNYGGVSDTASFSTWQSQCGCDSHSFYQSSLSLNADGTPILGSPVIGVGANLTSLGITALNSDLNGLARPAVAAWDIGAYQYAAAPTPPGSMLYIATMAMILLCLFLLPILKDPPVVEQQQKVEVVKWRM